MSNIRLTDHAIMRYRDRVKPHLTIDQAKAEMLRLLEFDPPIVAGPPHLQDEGEHFCELAPGIWLALERNVATSTLTNGGFSDERRTEKNKRKAAKRRRRAARNRRNGNRHNKGSRRPQEAEW